jgi:antiviral defense system Shedu protein SduA/AAA domain-containing protein
MNPFGHISDDGTSLLRETFTGRNHELGLLDQMLDESGGSPAFIVGPAGVGKTTLCRAYELFQNKKYAGTIFCSASQFASPNALIDYIDYQRIRISNQQPSSASNRKRDNRPLLIVDDVDRFSDQEASYLLTLLHSRSPQLVSLCTSRERFRFLEISEIPSLELRLTTLSESEILVLLTSRVELMGGNRTIVARFLKGLNHQGLRPGYLTPQIILQLFNSYMKQGDLSRAVSELLARGVNASNLVILEHEGRLRALPVFQGSPTEIVAPSKQPLYAAPYVLIPHLSAIWRAQLEEFEDLLADMRSNERTFQSFFEAYPHFLQGIAYDRVLAHPSLVRDEGGVLIPDFMLQPLGSSFADILDLKRPGAKLVTSRKDRRHFAHGVHEAIAQVREYREYFENSKYRRTVYERYGITAYRPSTLIVIGRQPESLTEEEMKRIAGDIPAFVQVQTYDDVLRKMRRMVELKEV